MIENVEGDYNVNVENLVKMNYANVQFEIAYWNFTVFCYVVGANPPPHDMEGFVRCM